MIKTTVGVDGMSCAMCEAHVRDVISKEFSDSIHTIRASAKKNTVVILSSSELDEAKIREALKPTGYEMTSFQSEPYEKESFIAKLKKLF